MATNTIAIYSTVMPIEINRDDSMIDFLLSREARNGMNLALVYHIRSIKMKMSIKNVRRGPLNVKSVDDKRRSTAKQ